MSIPKTTILMTATCLAAWIALGSTLVGQSEETIYDLYQVGIPTAAVTVAGERGNTTLSIRTRDRMTLQWSNALRTTPDAVRTLRGTGLTAPLRSALARIAEFSEISWNSLSAVGWPDADTIYVRHKEMREQVSGQFVEAVYWAEKDASNPLDFVIDPSGELVAAIQVASDLVLVRRGYEGFTILSSWRDPLVSQPIHAIRGPFKHMVEMSDGVRLSTLVYLPDSDASGASFPVILVRTPYGISNLISAYWHHVARGYAVVLQACRGTSYRDPENQSEGTFELVINEPADGATALSWVTRQPWSNGNIGMQGGSYVGYTQWAASMADNPALKILIPESSMGTVFADQPYMGGGFVTGLAYYMFWMLDTALLPGRQWTDVLRHRPLIDIDQYGTGTDIPQWNTLLDNWTNAGYWQRQNWHGKDQKRQFATLQTSGWFDDDLPGTRSNWELMQQKGQPPQQLIIGPWRHGTNRDRNLNGFSFGPDSIRDDIRLIKQRWYDRVLKGIDNGIDGTRVDYFVLGENKWRTSDHWPPPQVEHQSWFLHSQGSANRNLADGVLDRVSPTNHESSEEFSYDPQDPTPNWRSFELMKNWEDVQSYPYDFNDIERRQDVAVFSSSVLASDLTIAGDVRLVLYASTDARDTDWWAHVSDVGPGGESVRLTVGMLRARFRNREDPRHGIFGANFETEELLSGEISDVVRYEITLPPIANTFKKGHRVRIAVMNSLDFYTFPNSNTGEKESRVRTTVPARIRIHHSLVAPSQVLLPVLPH